MNPHDQPGRFALIQRYWSDPQFRAAYDAERDRWRQDTTHTLFAAHDARVRERQERLWAEEGQ